MELFSALSDTEGEIDLNRDYEMGNNSGIGSAENKDVENEL